MQRVHPPLLAAGGELGGREVEFLLEADAEILGIGKPHALGQFGNADGGLLAQDVAGHFQTGIAHEGSGIHARERLELLEKRGLAGEHVVGKLLEVEAGIAQVALHAVRGAAQEIGIEAQVARVFQLEGVLLPEVLTRPAGGLLRGSSP